MQPPPLTRERSKCASKKRSGSHLEDSILSMTPWDTLGTRNSDATASATTKSESRFRKHQITRRESTCIFLLRYLPAGSTDPRALKNYDDLILEQSSFGLN